jgi:magnesium chelatase subunit I
LWGVIPSITGKVELVYEGEQEGSGFVAQNLLGQAIRAQFIKYFPNPEAEKKKGQESIYKTIVDWFGDGETLDLLSDASNSEYEKSLKAIPGLEAMISKQFPSKSGKEHIFLMEFALHGLAEYSMLSRKFLSAGLQFKDLLGGIFDMGSGSFEEEDKDY